MRNAMSEGAAGDVTISATSQGMCTCVAQNPERMGHPVCEGEFPLTLTESGSEGLSAQETQLFITAALDPLDFTTAALEPP